MPNSRYVADRLRAHARLYRHIAEETWNEDKARELVRLADECTHAADSIAPEGGLGCRDGAAGALSLSSDGCSLRKLTAST